MTHKVLGGQTGVTGNELLTRLLNLQDKADSLVSNIVMSVARDIIVGRLPPGSDLNSIDLAKRFRSSRTPVREALLVLEKEGLIVTQARRRPRVNELSVQQIFEIYQLRAELYGLVSRKVATNAAPPDLDVLERILAGMKEAAQIEDLEGYFWHNVLFHEQAAGFARDSTLKRSIDGLGLQTLQFRHMSLSLPGRMQLSLADHQRLVCAYQEHDADLAVALGRTIILSARRHLITALKTPVIQPSPPVVRARKKDPT